jgi:predicted LPLAT superfamily acyltransferase
MPVAHTQVPMLHGSGRMSLELLAMALSQFVHEIMTFRYVLWTDRAARASQCWLRRFRDRGITEWNDAIVTQAFTR